MTMSVNQANILIIEDDTEIQGFICRVAEMEGHNCFKASAGEEGLIQVQDNDVHLIILDLRLPDMDGISIIREIKSAPELCHIPIIVMTAVAESWQREETYNLGVASYLIKPLSADALRSEIARVLESTYA